MSTDVYARIAARQQRWGEFYARQAGARFMLHVHCDPEPPLPRPWPNPEHKQARLEWAWTVYQRQLKRVAAIDDDFIPALDPFTGTEIFAEAFGCQVHRPEDNMPFALPLVTSAAEADRIKVPDVASTSLAMLFEIGDELRRRAGPQAVMKLVDTQSPMDTVALIWDKNDLYASMLEAPEAVKGLAAKVHTLFTRFLDEWFRRYGREFIAHYPWYYMPQGVTLSEDEVGIVNPEMFREFFLPELNALSDRYGGIGIHCCANSKHQWPNFSTLRNLRLLNICQPPDVIKDAYEFFAGVTAQHHGFWDGKVPICDWPQQLPAGTRMVMETSAPTVPEAQALLAKLRAATTG